MKTYYIFFVLLVIIVTSSCEKNEIEYGYEAIVVANVNSGITFCNKDVFDIKIINGEDKIKSLFDYDFNITDSIYLALNLPEEFKKIGTSIKLDIRAPISNERPSCYSGEMPLLVGPVLYIIRAGKK